MDILEVKVLRGPNYWSNYRKNLIVILLDLKEFEELPTNQLPNFVNNLTTILPSLNDHYCSYNHVGGLIKRLQEGTWLGHVIEHVALELQTLAGSPCGFGRTRSTDTKGVYEVVYSYEYEGLGKKAGEVAFELINVLAHNKIYQTLENDLTQLKKILQQEKNGPSTEALLKEAKERNIPYKILDQSSLILLGHGCHQKMLWTTISSHTGLIGSDIASDKSLTKSLLQAEYIPVPNGMEITNEDELNIVYNKIHFPWAIKPLNANHGKGVTVNINSLQQALVAFNQAQQFSKRVIVEQFIPGKDYRILVIDYKVVAVANRIPASIIGTGKQTIKELIEEANKNPIRGAGHDNYLTYIKFDEDSAHILKQQGVTLETVIPAGNLIYLKQIGNISTGGTAINVTKEIHQENIFLAERIARILQLDICGIDLITRTISEPMTADNGAIIEVNACPGLRMHLFPTEGDAINVAKPIIDMLFPKNTSSRIPITAVTGTNGKTTVVRLIAHLASLAGRTVGFTTTDGIYINTNQIAKGDCAGPNSVYRILRDPIVDFAVFETARGGIIRSGLGFDHCNISIVTNISEDHLGTNGINRLEELARVKSVVPRSTFKDGYAILNADDDLVFSMRQDLDCHIALFSVDANNQRIYNHCKEGGLAAYIADDYLIIQDGHLKKNILKVTSLPITFHGKSLCMIKNLLPVVLASILNNIDTDTIKNALLHFSITPETLPGRMNIFKFDTVELMLDYAHNPDAFSHLKDFMNTKKYHIKTGIIAATGDRRAKDIIKIGALSAEIFDKIIIRHDVDGRGRSNEELTDLLLRGIKSVNKIASVKIISNEFDALKYAFENASLNSFIFYFPDNVANAFQFIDKIKQTIQVSSPKIEGSYYGA